MKLVIATTVLALTAGSAFAQGPAAEELQAPEFTKPEIAFVDAANIINANGNGEIIAMELDAISEERPVYVADLEADFGMSRIMIDGTTGDVLASERIAAADEATFDAYMEHFSTQAETAEMMMLASLIDEGDVSYDDIDDLDEEELEKLLHLAEEEGLFDEDHKDDVEDLEDASDDLKADVSEDLDAKTTD